MNETPNYLNNNDYYFEEVSPGVKILRLKNPPKKKGNEVSKKIKRFLNYLKISFWNFLTNNYVDLK